MFNHSKKINEMKTYFYKGYTIENRPFISFDDEWNVKEQGSLWHCKNAYGYEPICAETLKDARNAINAHIASLNS